MIEQKKWLCRAVLVILCLAILSLLAHSESRKESEDLILIRVGFAEAMFSDVDIQDAQMALDIWMQKLTRDEGRNFDVESIIYKSMDDMVKAVRNNELDMIQISGVDYLELFEGLPLEPAIAPERAGSPLEYFVLLAHRKKNFNDIAQLANGILLYESGPRSQNSLLWLKYLLAKSGLEKPESFFKSLRNIDKLSQVILPVFFGQADACIVHKNSLVTMNELNPQVGRDLVILHESPALLNYMSCFLGKFDNEARDRILETAFTLHRTVEGRQILTLFHIEKAQPFDPIYLENLRSLLKEYKKFLKDKTNGKAQN